MSIELKKLKEENERLKNELKAFKSDTSLIRMYLGVKKQIEDISKILNDTTLNSKDLSSKEDKLFDRYFKFLESSKGIAETFIYLEKLILPKIEEDREHGGILEEALNV